MSLASVAIPITNWPQIMKALRPKQWAKNIFALAVLPTALIEQDINGLINLVYVVLSLMTAASSVYLLNDIFDVEEDRNHPKKRYRPIASGMLPLPTAYLIFIALTVFSIYFSLLVNWLAFATVSSYLILSHLYSWKLKHTVHVEMLIVSILYPLRVFAGNTALTVEAPLMVVLSQIVLSGLLAYSIILGKRISELRTLKGTLTRKVLTNYTVEQMNWMYFLNFVGVGVVHVFFVFTVSPYFFLFYLCTATGLWRFNWLINKLTEDTHPQKVIAQDKPLLGILTLYSIAFLFFVSGFDYLDPITTGGTWKWLRT